jgi:Zn-dependent protease
MAVVSLAGPIANILMAAVAAVPINLGIVGRESLGFAFEGNAADVAGYVLGVVVYWNLLLAAFNLIPLVPLDGFKVAVGVLPRGMALWFAQLERFGSAPLIVLVMLSYILPGAGLLSAVIRPMIEFMASIIVW